jgi:hypothetical protein
MNYGAFLFKLLGGEIIMSKVKDVKQHMEPVTMELGGKVWTLQFDMNAFAELEKRFNTIEEAMEQLAASKISDIKIILWTALIHEAVEEFDEETGEPIKYSITPYNVGSWIKSPAMLQQVSEKLGEAMSAGMPDPEDLPDNVKQMLADSELGKSATEGQTPGLPVGTKLATVKEEPKAKKSKAKNSKKA